jgi:ribosomal protein L22
MTATENEPDEPTAKDATPADEAPPKAKTRAKAKPAAKAADGESAAETAAEPVAEAGAEPAEAKPKRARRKPAAAKASATKATAGEAEDKPKPRRTRRKAEPDKPAAPAPRKKRAAHDYGDNPPMVRAHAKYVRTSARKARLVCDHIRGKSVEEARAILAHASRDVARDWSKLLESAVANAEHNHELIGDELRIAAVKADEGPTLKRFRPRAMGRATKIRKRTSHLSITLTPKDGDR